MELPVFLLLLGPLQDRMTKQKLLDIPDCVYIECVLLQTVSA